MTRELAKGDIPVLVLRVLSGGSCHGYAIAREIERQTGGDLTLREGSLYPALRALENGGFIEGAWETPPSGPARKVYRLLEAGQAELERRTRAWLQYTRMIGQVLRGEAHEHRA